ncbi:hypothetical protein F2P81_017881 [Scophthalmus maximus]|uniref:F-box domain-containing protein n=1 Tax=Scophthalmus maximus TaxID=52904 RepID=A0A6A4S0P1_SCOMX|nr:hypothetical protein F2P81_017881 [Scophthalmus maximus]
MMAAGRGDFFRSLRTGLERRPAQPAPCRRPAARGRGSPGPDERPAGGRGRRRPPTSEASLTCGSRDPSCLEARRECHSVKPPPKENFVERLPPEILIKILSHLDASSLFSIGHVSKLFHRLASDDAMWRRIFMSEFGRHMWRPKSAAGAAAEVGDLSPGHWKMIYLRTVTGHDVNMWRRELRDISPYTGLPSQTEWVLRNLNVSWELTLRDSWGQESRLQHSRAFFFESSVIISWSRGSFASCHHISSIQLHGVRREAPRSPRVRPDWRSLILKVDMKTRPWHFLGRDRLIKLLHPSPGVIIGVWRGQSIVAFIMVCLHLHKLVEKSLLGSPACPYYEPEDRPPPSCDSDPAFGLHGFTLHFVLHNTGTEIMSGHFRQLSCGTVQSQRELVEVKVINKDNLSQHRSLSGNVKLPWKSEALEGAVENCCVMTLTLLDELLKPFWCVSSPVCVKMAKRPLDLDYGGEHFLMEHREPGGKVRMTLVWLKEQKQFFLVSLTVYISVSRVNRHLRRGDGCTMRL